MSKLMLTMIYGGGDDGADDYGGMHFPILVLFYCSTCRYWPGYGLG